MDTTRGPNRGLAEKIVVLAVDPKTLSGFPLSALRSTNWHLFKFGNIQRINQMRIRTIAAALAAAAPLFALESPSAAACVGVMAMALLVMQPRAMGT